MISDYFRNFIPRKSRHFTPELLIVTLRTCNIHRKLNTDGAITFIGTLQCSAPLQIFFLDRNVFMLLLETPISLALNLNTFTQHHHLMIAFWSQVCPLTWQGERLKDYPGVLRVQEGRREKEKHRKGWGKREER